MANINEILARAASLRDETALNSIDPERAGGIMYDTLLALNELWLQQGAALVISKIYASVAAMNADTSPVSDLTGKPIRPGMVVVIASSDSDNGSVYRYNGTSSPRWSLVGEIGNITPEDSLTSDSTQLPLAAHQGKVLDGKISQLGQDVKNTYGDYVENPEWVNVATDSEDKILYGVKIDGDFFFGAGVPSQVQEEIDTVADTKVNKVEGKSLIDEEYASSQSTVENLEWLKVIVDSQDKILCGIKADGTFSAPAGIEGEIYNDRREVVIDSNFQFKSENAFSLRFKLKMKNAHSVNRDTKFLSISNGSFSIDFLYQNRPTSTPESNPSRNVIVNNAIPGNAAFCPAPIFNSLLNIKVGGQSFAYIGTDYGIRRNFLLGEDAFSIRFTGDCTVAANQDIRISIDDTYVKLYHSTNNSVIKQYTKSSYTTLYALYNAIQSDIDNYSLPFELEFFNLDNVTINDIIECDVPLVSEYYIDKEFTQRAYDAFPFYFMTRDDNREYDCEFCYNETLPYFVIDGYRMRLNNVPNITNFSNANINIVFEEGSYNDVELRNKIVNTKECKQITPNIRMYYFEAVSEDLEQGSSLAASLRRVAGVFNLLRAQGCKYLTMDEIKSWLNGGLYLEPGDYFHIGHDDSGYYVVQNDKIRSTYLSNSIYPSIAMMTKLNSTIPNAENYIACRNIGFQLHVHCAPSDTPELFGSKGIGTYTFSELAKACADTKTAFFTWLKQYPDMWDFHWITENWNVISYLKNHGFPIMFGGNGTGSINKINRFRIDRVQSDENAVPSYDTIISRLNGIASCYEQYL